MHRVYRRLDRMGELRRISAFQEQAAQPSAGQVSALRWPPGLPESAACAQDAPVNETTGNTWSDIIGVIADAIGVDEETQTAKEREAYRDWILRWRRSYRERVAAQIRRT